jgi:hypothetical protein
MNKKHNNIACFILSYEITKGMKSWGPIGLLKSCNNGKELVLCQIDSLRHMFDNPNITIVSGFGHEKLDKKLPSDVNILVNNEFETKNQGYIVKLILSQYKLNDFAGIFIMTHNTLLKRFDLNGELPFNKSWVLVKPIKKTREKSKFMGFTTKKTGEIEHIYYDIGQHMWCDNFYMCNKDIGLIKPNIEQYYDNMFLFEVINKSIANNINYDKILIPSDGHSTITGMKDKHKIKEEYYAKN